MVQGTATVTIMGAGKYTGFAYVNFTITQVAGATMVEHMVAVAVHRIQVLLQEMILLTRLLMYQVPTRSIMAINSLS